MKLGARIIKTGIAVTISLYIAIIFNLEPIIFAAVAAVLSIQPSLYRSWQNVLDQIQSNVIGAVLAISFAYFLGNDPFIVGLVVIIVIAINIQLKMEKSIPLSIITVIAIMESTTGNFFIFALDRFLLILIGIGSSFLVNTIFLPPKYEDRLYTKIHEVNQSILSYLRLSVTRELDDKTLREEVKRLKEELIAIDQLYLLYKEERTYLQKVKYSKTRKLVLFRQMIQTIAKALSLLRNVERYQAELQTVASELVVIIQKEIEMLSSYNEKILLKYEGKIKPNHPDHLPTNIFEEREALVANFMILYQQAQNNEQKEWIYLFPIVSKIIDYSDQLERLDKLMDSYYTFHQ